MPNAQASGAQYQAGYPLFLDIRGKNVVVVGGGEVGRRKIDTLLSYGAHVKVISPAVVAHVQELADSGAIELHARPYCTGDLEDAVLAFSACGNPRVDQAVVAEGKARNCPVNVVDVPQLCDFIVPSIVSRGPLSIAISTSGAAPTEAKRIRAELEERYDENWDAYLQLVGAVRTLVKQRIAGSEEDRRPVYEASCSLDWLHRLANGQAISVEDAYQEAYAAAFPEEVR